jgi:hypothetical protein
MNLKREKNVVVGIVALALLLAVISIGTLSITAADVFVTRELPDEAVKPNEDIRVTVTQSGFFYDTGWVNETIPEGFEYQTGSVVDGDGYTVVIPQDLEESPRVITLEFGQSENETTLSYIVVAKSETAITNAVFTGEWTTLQSLTPLNYLSGAVTGDTTLTLAVPTPTPSPTSEGGNNGGGGGGATTPTPTGTVGPDETPLPTDGTTPLPTDGTTPLPTGGTTASPEITPSGSPGMTPTETPGPTKRPLIPGFEGAFAIAGLLAVSFLVLRSAKV